MKYLILFLFAVSAGASTNMHFKEIPPKSVRILHREINRIESEKKAGWERVQKKMANVKAPR